MTHFLRETSEGSSWPADLPTASEYFSVFPSYCDPRNLQSCSPVHRESNNHVRYYLQLLLPEMFNFIDQGELKLFICKGTNDANIYNIYFAILYNE